MSSPPVPSHSTRDVLLMHGVGLHPSLLLPVAGQLWPTRCHMPLRLGYRQGTAPGSTIDALVDDVEALVTHPSVYVGLSGGATLGLALCIRAARRLVPSVESSTDPTGPTRAETPVHVILHEPLVGPLVRGLHDTIVERAAVLSSIPGPQAAEDFVRGLVGAPTWDGLPAGVRRFAARHHAVVRAEASVFATFAPTTDDLARIDLPLTVTVGADSPAVRHDAAAVLAEHTGATVVVIDGAGHLAPWQAPDTYAAIVRDALVGVR